MARIVVVDDSAEIRLLLRTLLETEGHTVVEAGHADEFFALALSRHDVVILDVMMPDVDGFAVLSQLRARGKDFPRIIMLTAKTGEPDRQRALGRGALGFLTKPFDPDDVIKEIERVQSQSDDKLAEQREYEIYMSRLLHQLETATRGR